MTTIEIRPRKKINASVIMPYSKSDTNRALICAALSEGKSRIYHSSQADDCTKMKEALRRLGVVIEEKKDKLHVIGKHPTKLRPVKSSKDTIDVGDAGTTMRFLTGLCSLIPGSHRLVGSERMHQRPIDDLVNALDNIIYGKISAESDYNSRKCPPVNITTKGLKGGRVEIRTDTCSQFLSSLLMAAPYAKKDMIIIPVGEFLERPYVNMTVSLMRHFGARIEEKKGKYYIRAGQTYKTRDYVVSSDASSASYFMAAAALTHGHIEIGRFFTSAIQGDLGFIHVLKEMGCKAKHESMYIEVKGPRKLKAIDVNLSQMPDTVPTLAFLAAFAEGTTTITGIANLRYKECDRISALEEELGKMQIKTESTPGTLIIYGGKPKAATLDSHGDHRFEMIEVVAGLAVPGIKIENAGQVSKSFPNFYDLIEKL